MDVASDPLTLLAEEEAAMRDAEMDEAEDEAIVAFYEKLAREMKPTYSTFPCGPRVRWLDLETIFAGDEWAENFRFSKE